MTGSLHTDSSRNYALFLASTPVLLACLLAGCGTSANTGPVTSSTEELFTVPPGDHDVEVQLEDTTLRRLGNGISLLSWSALVLAALGMLSAPGLSRWGARIGLGRQRAA